MANTPWSVHYTNVDPAIGPNDPVPLGGKVVGSLTSALADAPLSEWTFEVGGEPVATFEEFQKLYSEAPSAEYGEFVARSGSIVVESA